MRWAKSYSIVDHALLHGGYFNRLSHEALSLYLFLVVVGDQDGKSYYGERTICEILRLNGDRFQGARRDLVDAGLISFCSPYFWVKTLKPVSKNAKQDCTSQGEEPNDEARLKLLLKQLELLREEK